MQRITSFLFIIVLTPSVQAQIDTLKNEHFSIHAQTTVVNQFKPAFKAPYSGDNSLVPEKESQTSLTSTLFFGAKLWKGASIFINPEIAGGSGLSSALGVGDATNGETFRVGDPAPKIYLARLFYRQVFALTDKTTYQASDFNQLAEHSPEKYWAVTIGKIGVADYFDDNKYSHDPRTQFMCWGLMANGAWDYPANTRGYTPSFILEYVTPQYELRYDVSLLPKTANGNSMNWNIVKSSSHNLELTRHYKFYNQYGAVRLLAFFNTTNMGNYRQSIVLNPKNPEIENVRQYGNTKYGFAINAEQDLTKDLGCFLRASWNDGNNETWAFTEIDHTISAGISMKSEKCQRKNDNWGLAYVTSGISKPHQEYLAAGGKGFMLGDGKLNYRWEQLLEVYYKAELVKDRIYVSGAYQFLLNPGYNRDRHGAVNVFSVRLHTRI